MGKLSRGADAHLRIAVALVTFGLVLTASVVLGGAPAVADTAPAAGTPATVSADPLPTVQQNGVVYSQVTVGNIVYATGSFGETWPAGQAASSSNETARANLLAYNITTGALVTSFAPQALNAQGLGIAASTDGSTIYVVGDFTAVGSVARGHIAAFNAGTGALEGGFAAGVSAEAAAVTVTSSAVYVGGNFFSADGVARTRLAAFAPSTGALLSWAPSADDGQVAALAVVPASSRVIVGGRFTTLNSQPASGMGSLDAVSGATEPWAINTVVLDGSTSGKCGITDLSVKGSTVFGGGFAYGCGNFEGTFADAATGNVTWINDCHGDTYGTKPIGSVLYVASHAHDCSVMGSFPDASPTGKAQRATAFTTAATGGTDGHDPRGWNFQGRPDSSLLTWFPTLSPGTVTQQDQAAWSVTGNANYVAYGGEFPTVNGTAQAGLVRFAVRSHAPNKSGPVATTSATTLVPTASSPASGQVDLSWTATWDRDNAVLTYTIVRDGTAVGTVTQASSFWLRPPVTYTDTGLAPGTTHTYRIRVTDPLGNSIGSATSQPVSVSGTGQVQANTGPNAAFTSTCAQLTCTLDAGSSTDTEGTITSYTWDFGHGPTGGGVTTSHTFGSGGAHTVTLTVTDDDGNSSNPDSQSVQTVAPAAVWASDSFDRTVTSGWGRAGVGGRWSQAGCPALSVTPKVGHLVAARAAVCSTWLPKVHRTRTDTTVALRAASVPKGGLQVAVLGRRVSAGTDVRVRLDLRRSGSIAVTLMRRVHSKAAALSRTVTVTPASIPDGRFFVRLRVLGTSRTLVRAKVWHYGAAEPSAWTVTGRSGAVALRHNGSVGIAAALCRAHTSAKATLRVTRVVSRDVAG